MRAIGLLLLCVATQALGRTPQVSATPPPVVLMIRSATTAEGKRHEAKLFDELGFALDGFMVLSQAAEQSDFGSLPLAIQIATVLPEANRNGAMVVVWLAFPLPNQIMLHVIAIGSGRALIRSIETNKSPVSETALALMARELLGTAYLFESPKDVPAEVAEVVQSVKKQITPLAPPPEPPKPAPVPPAPGRAYSLWFRTDADYPLAGGADAVPVWRGQLGAEVKLPLELEVGLGATGSYGTVDRPNVEGARYWSAGGTLSVFRGFSLAPLLIGPRLAATVEYASFQGPPPVVGGTLPSFALGLEARSTGEGPTVAMSFSGAYAPLRAQLTTGDGTVLFRTPTIQLLLGLAVGWRGL